MTNSLLTFVKLAPPEKRFRPKIEDIMQATCKILRMAPRELTKQEGLPWRTPKQIQARRIIIYLGVEYKYSFNLLGKALYYNTYFDKQKQEVRVDHSSVMRLAKSTKKLPEEEAIAFYSLCVAVKKDMELTLRGY